MGKIIDFNNWKKIEFKYKKGNLISNPRNILNLKNKDETEEFVQSRLYYLRRIENEYKKMSELNSLMQMTVGNMITKECFIRILKSVDLTLDRFVDYIRFIEELNPLNKISNKWFHRLDAEYHG